MSGEREHCPHLSRTSVGCKRLKSNRKTGPVVSVPPAERQVTRCPAPASGELANGGPEAPLHRVDFPAGLSGPDEPAGQPRERPNPCTLRRFGGVCCGVATGMRRKIGLRFVLHPGWASRAAATTHCRSAWAMTFLKRLRVLPVVLGVAAALAAVTTTLFGDVRTDTKPGTNPTAARPDGGAAVEELAATKFSKLPALTYQPRDGETLFAWQVKPNLEPTPARPRDILILVDTSASQAGTPLRQARQIITALSSASGASDRISVWTLSTPAATRALTRDFQPADADEVRHAAAALTEVEYAAGATDLKGGLRRALATLAPTRTRQQLVLLLGDGESTFDPLTEDDR